MDDHKHCDICSMKCDHRIQKVIMVANPTIRRADREKPAEPTSRVK